MAGSKQKIKAAKNKALAGIAALQTLVDSVPVLITADKVNGAFSEVDKFKESSLYFMFDLLKALGIYEEQLIRWLVNLLGDDELGNGFLNTVENAVKAILVLNCKNMFTCSASPLIPDDLCFKGIDINLQSLDLYDLMDKCPTDIDSSVYYFDTVKIITRNRTYWHIKGKQGYGIETRTVNGWNYNVYTRINGVWEKTPVKKWTENESEIPNYAIDSKEPKSKQKKIEKTSIDGRPETLAGITKEECEERGWKYKTRKIDMDTEDATVANNAATLNGFKVTEETETITEKKGYTPNRVYMSYDFNAYLWYVIHKGNITDGQELIWDNRVKYIKEFNKDEDKRWFPDFIGTGNFKEKFFESKNNNNSLGKSSNGGSYGVEGYEKYKKHDILTCRFKGDADKAETGYEYINVTLNPSRYYKSRGLPGSLPAKLNIKAPEKSELLKNEVNALVEFSNDYYNNALNAWDKKYDSLRINKTIFEFNADYVYSLKLFDTKVLTANILNNLLKFATSGTIVRSHKNVYLETKIEDMVKNLMMQGDGDDAYADNCFFKFSNEEYDAMLNKTSLKRAGLYDINGNPENTMQFNSFDFNASFNALEQARSTEERYNIMSDTFKSIADSQAENVRTNTTSGQDSVNFQFNLITAFIQETVLQICMQALSPKVFLLYAINAKIMGDLEEDNWKSLDIEFFYKNMENLITKIIMEIKDLVINELKEFIINYVKQLVEVFVMELVKEALSAYSELLKNLLSLLASAKSLANTYLDAIRAFVSGVQGSNLGLTEANMLEGLSIDDLIGKQNGTKTKDTEC